MHLTVYAMTPSKPPFLLQIIDLYLNFWQFDTEHYLG